MNGICSDKTTQSCCPDPHNGAVACEVETSQCCPPNNNLQIPSRCCPRWYVCCDYGRYGCCNPQTMRPIDLVMGLLAGGASGTARAVRGLEDRIRLVGEKKKGASSVVDAPASFPAARALIEMTSIKDASPLYSFNIDLTKGSRNDGVPVSGIFNDWGESTRRFAYDRSRKVFYLPQANFTGGASVPEWERLVHLYTIDSSTGAVNIALVSAAAGGAQPLGLVTGFAFDSDEQLLLVATRSYNTTGGATGYLFWSVNVLTGGAVLVSSQQASGPIDTYAGYFRHMAVVDGRVLVLRMNWQDVVHQQNPGLGVTDITSGSAVTDWVTIQPPKGYLALFTLTVVSAANGTLSIVSLASGDGLSTDLALFALTVRVSGTLSVSGPSKVASLGNGHITPYFGPLGTAYKDGVFAALTVHDSADPNLDLWAVSTVELPSGRASTRIMSPLTLAGTDSISGFDFE